MITFFRRRGSGDPGGELLDAVRRLAAANADKRDQLARVMQERDELRGLLADMVRKSTDYGEQDGGFVAMYLLPTGPIHRAIAWLGEHGIQVRPGARCGEAEE